MLARTAAVPKIATKIYYNEQKVKAQQAECIYGANFLQDAADLTPDDKRKRFNDALELHQRTFYTALNVVLQFAPEEQFNKEKLIAIAASYMQRLGYGDQPYLIYQHTDTAVPHLHIVTITIRPDGCHIRTPFTARLFSEPARKAVEQEFGLVKAAGHRRSVKKNPGPARRVEYGKLPSEEAIADSLQYILENFRYRSIDELNAILGLYNLTAKTGRPGSRLHQFGGLLYQILDKKGQGRGAPVKASSLPFKPTLRWLAQKFAENKTPDPIAVRDTRLALDAVLRENPSGPKHFKDALRRNYLAVSPHLLSKTAADNLLLVNLEHRTILDIKELGKDYDLPAIRQKLQPGESIQPSQATKQQTKKNKQKRSL